MAEEKKDMKETRMKVELQSNKNQQEVERAYRVLMENREKKKESWKSY